MIKETTGMTFRHQMPAQLRFSDIDKFGHMNNSVYFSLFDMCKTRYFIDVLGQHVFDNLGIVVAHIDANFLAPIFYPDEIAIQTTITHLGNKSFTLFQRAVNTRTKEVKCECTTVMVFFDTVNNCSIQMPESFKQKISEYEKGE
ncbi:MAG: acyl-CoA thioesterase [Bacteroidales bacterium]|nr:acyl-CoA thioesterase [Bacteroidales bacterium]MCM1146969.1 acyl-CoA thioesterase [Bacteroidales bacterium]MCM1205898.1 acyl-CoA thioesterase [Bacillota bacterium]MCM1509861.1 acyl-CoA thioesterase [Clostridium sp.]